MTKGKDILSGIKEKILNLTKKQWVFIFFLCLSFAMWLTILFLGRDKYVDEKTHYRQIGRFIKGNYDILPNLTTIPGYHAAIALSAKVFGDPSQREIRLISFVLSLLSLWVFFAIAKKLEVRDPLIRTLQFVFLPVSFFYFPLIYTDIFALLLVLLAFYFALNKRYSLSALFSAAAILTRQTDIVWIAFIWLYAYVSEYGFLFSPKMLLPYARKTIGYGFVFIAFAIFVWLNKGIAIGDKLNHPVGVYMGNIYFFLAIVGFLFFPILIASLRRIELSKWKSFVFFGIGGAVLACSFAIFPPTLHIGNLKLTFLRNIILDAAYHQHLWAYVLAIFLGFAALLSMQIERKYLLLFPFIAASLLPSFLIEQRYYIVPLVFLLLLRPEKNSKMEFLLVLYFLAITVALMYMLFNTSLFF